MSTDPQPENTKRLYRIREGSKICGVCKGLEAYTGVDVTVIRVLFVIGALLYSAGFWLYLIIALVASDKPAAPGSKAEADGNVSPD